MIALQHRCTLTASVLPVTCTQFCTQRVFNILFKHVISIAIQTVTVYKTPDLWFYFKRDFDWFSSIFYLDLTRYTMMILSVLMEDLNHPEATIHQYIQGENLCPLITKCLICTIQCSLQDFGKPSDTCSLVCIRNSVHFNQQII